MANEKGFPALSVRQPWADYIVLGIKDVENRSKPTNFRGTILIHASQTIDSNAGFTEAEQRALVEAGLWNAESNEHVARTGLILGMVDIVDCVVRSKSAYFEGPFGWVLSNPVAFDRPLEFKGKVGIFYVPTKSLKGSPAEGATPARSDELATTRILETLARKAESGDVESQFELAEQYYLRERFLEAVPWYTRAAEAGHSDAQINLGMMFANGEGIPVDLDRAVSLYRQAADQGNPFGHFNLAMELRERGDDTAGEVVRLLRLAAEKGLSLAATALGAAYQDGDGVERSSVEAAQWYLRALEGGDEAAAEKLSEILPELRERSTSGDNQVSALLKRAQTLGFSVD